jgi:hypothetical protein
MNERGRGFAPPQESPKPDAFERRFAEGEIADAAFVDMPDDVQEMLESLGMMYLNPDKFVPGQFRDGKRVTIGADEAYVASKIKEYGGAGKEESTYVVDVRNGEVAGYGEIRWHLENADEYFKDKPFVGYTKTMEGHRRQGLAERRLRLMNAVAREKYGLPIHSDTVIAEGAKAMWEKLVKEGRARKYKEGEHDRYVYEDAE